MWTTLADACAVLTPAWAGQPQAGALLQCFLSGLQDHPQGQLLALDPVAGVLLPGRVTVDLVAQGGQHIQVTGTLVRQVLQRAELLVRRAPVARPVRARRIIPGPDPAVCSFIPQGLGLGRCHLPVLDIGSRGVSVLSRVPLAVGTSLRDVVVVSRAAHLRHAQGAVKSCTALVLVGGRPAWRCGVALRESGEARPVPGTEDAELSDPQRVRAILWGLADLRSDVQLHVGARTARAVLLEGRGNRDAVPTLEAQLEDGGTLPAGVAQVATNLYASGYHFMARVRPTRPGHVSLSPAGLLRQVFRREDARVNLAHEPDARVTWRHPLEGNTQDNRLLDLSVDGFGMEVDAQAAALWSGMPLKDVTVHLPGQGFATASAVVRVVDGKRVGVRMAPLPAQDAERLRLALVARSHPAITFHDGGDLDGILAFHRKVKLLEPAMAENLECALGETRRTWALAHQHPDGLMRTAVGRRGDEVNATLTLVRAYDSSWALQHAAVLHPTVQPSPGTLHGALSSLVYPRPDGEYLFGYLADDVPSQHALMDAFLNTASTPEHRGRQDFHVLAGRSAPPSGGTPQGVRRIPASLEALVEHAARRVMDPVCAEALALRKGHLTLPDSRRDYARLGLARGREALGVWRKGVCVAVLLREWSSPGLCLSSMLNAAMFIPVFEEADPDGSARTSLLRLALTLPLHGNPPWRLVLAPAPWDVGQTAAGAGLSRLAGCTLYAFHRHGQREYHHYVASRYGLLHARLNAPAGEAA